MVGAVCRAVMSGLDTHLQIIIQMGKRLVRFNVVSFYKGV